MMKDRITRVNRKEQQVLAALNKIGRGSAEDVILELSRKGLTMDPLPYLQVLLDKGQIGGEKVGGVMNYHLNS